MNDLKLVLLIVAAVTGVVNLIAIGVGISFVLQAIKVAFLGECEKGTQ